MRAAIQAGRWLRAMVSLKWPIKAVT
jgi:hypothetical protein